MPSIWYEGFGLIAMEAMLRGVPVISSDSGGLKEAKHGTGFVVPVQARGALPARSSMRLTCRSRWRREQDLGPWARRPEYAAVGSLGL